MKKLAEDDFLIKYNGKHSVSIYCIPWQVEVVASYHDTRARNLVEACELLDVIHEHMVEKYSDTKGV